MRYLCCCCVIPTKIPPKPFCYWWRVFNAFLSIFAVKSFTTHGQNKTRRFDTEGLVPVASVCGVVGSPSWVIKCLIGKIVNIWWVVFINSKCMYSSETWVCTIIECAIVLNFHPVTSTWPLISWWYGSANVSCIPHT